MNTAQNKATLPFVITGFSAIVIGGILSAFSASQTSYLTAWATAYLVLVVGVFQLVLGTGTYKLAAKQLSYKMLMTVFTLFNIGNLAVLGGTILKEYSLSSSLVVDAGGLLIVLSLLISLVAVRKAPKSWSLIAFYIVTIIILISVPIGLWLGRYS